MHDLVIAITLGCIAELLWIVCYEIRLSVQFDLFVPIFDLNKVLRIMRDCFPLFMSTFLLLFLNNMPKYGIDQHYDYVMQTRFSALFMPAQVINLIGMFIFRPYITELTDLWNNKKAKALKRIITIQLSIVVGLTVSAMIFAQVAGAWILSVIYGIDLMEYKGALSIIMFGGGFNAVVWMFNNLLTIMRRQYFVLIGYGLGSLFALLASSVLIDQFAIVGASMLYMISMAVSAIVLGSTVVILARKSLTEI